ncbi:MAG: 16S rRNA (uracil(1498)-N(3))-methyltransferase [Treponema sp.]|nr:16S rRNA (uracil(1498)-N(3))-methyltransferase [Treponema sp.]
MNLIFFFDTELRPLDTSAGQDYAFLPRRDQRTVHLLKVLHKKEGDTFDAGVLEGKLGTGKITKITANGLHISLTLETDPPPRTPLRLGVGFPRPIQLKRLLRDCASLGLASVDLLGTELGEKSYRNTKLLDDGGARSALIEGAVQARDTRLPELAVYQSLNKWVQMDLILSNPSAEFVSQTPCIKPPAIHGGGKVPNVVLLAADNVRPQRSFSQLEVLQKDTEVVLAVGSERGWSDRERELLESAGFTRLSLGQRALRTETACIAAAVLVMEKMGFVD